MREECPGCKGDATLCYCPENPIFKKINQAAGMPPPAAFMIASMSANLICSECSKRNAECECPGNPFEYWRRKGIPM